MPEQYQIKRLGLTTMTSFLCPFHDNRPRELMDITDYQTQGVVYVLKYECPECGFKAEFNNETR